MILAFWETPPRAWGRPARLELRSRLDGNTPTGVGKTSVARLILTSKEKHPHGRGED